MKQYKKDILRPWVDEWKDDHFKQWNMRQLKSLITQLDERLLDIQVEEKVFKNKVQIVMLWNYDESGDYQYPVLGFIKECKEHDEIWEEEIELPNYSTDIKDAWIVIEKLNGDKVAFSLSTVWMHYKYFEWLAKFEFWGTTDFVFEVNESESKAICLAALKAVEHANK